MTCQDATTNRDQKMAAMAQAERRASQTWADQSATAQQKAAANWEAQCARAQWQDAENTMWAS